MTVIWVPHQHAALAIRHRAEKEAAAKGTDRLVLLTTRTADWFEQRGFAPGGAAHESSLLPEHRRTAIDPARNSKLFFKTLAAPGGT